jgi:hypothetical protein|tara:strand:- start:38 stop:601 length:564 start_codon:yes stop_codon:yes gene_type:complete
MKWIKSLFNFRNTKMMTDAMAPRLRDGKQVLDNANQPVFDKLEQRINKATGEILDVPAYGTPDYASKLAIWKQGQIVYTANIQIEFEIDPKVVDKLELTGSSQISEDFEVPPVLDAKQILAMDERAKADRDGKFTFNHVDGTPVEYSLDKAHPNIIQRTDGEDTVLIVSAIYKPAYARKNMRMAWPG